METLQSQTLNQETLVNELKSGGDAAFSKIYNYYAPIMLSHANRMLKDEEEAKDTVQELFINLHLIKDDLKKETNLSKLLYFSLRNRVISKIRKNKIYNNYLENYQINTHQYGVLENLYVKDIEYIIEKEIEKLSPRMREIFEMSRYELLTYKEIGEKMNISEHTVRSQIKKTIKSLRIKLPLFVAVIALYHLLSQLF